MAIKMEESALNDRIIKCVIDPYQLHEKNETLVMFRIPNEMIEQSDNAHLRQSCVEALQKAHFFDFPPEQ